MVRRIAQEEGVDLAEVPGTGLGGRVTKQDILSFVANRGAKAPAGPGKLQELLSSGNVWTVE